MNSLKKLTIRLDEIITQEKDEPLSVLGGYIIGAILKGPHELYASNSLVQKIDDLANRLELEDGTPKELQQDWDAIKACIKTLKGEI